MKTIFLRMLALTVVVLSSCGPNPYASYEKKDPAEDATVALENGDPQKAIDILSSALENAPGNQKYMSILSLAYAQRAGVDPLTLAQNMSSSSSSSTKPSGNGITALFGIMPAATISNIADVDQAINLLIAIPASDRQPYDLLKLAMFEMAALVLRSKALDLNGDGQLSTAELLAMSPDQAIAILTQLANAGSAFGGNTTGSTDKAVSEQITKIQSSIDAESGESTEEKLRNYLGKSST